MPAHVERVNYKLQQFEASSLDYVRCHSAPTVPPPISFTAFQFYFINALFAVGMVLGLMGLTIFLRWEYSLFGDPVGPLIFAVMFLFGDLVQKLLRVLADIKVHTELVVTVDG